jgi:hypothetical protein
LLPSYKRNRRRQDEDEDVTSSTEWILPSRLLPACHLLVTTALMQCSVAGEFQGLWPSLIYDANVKSELVDYALSSLLFGNYGVDPNIITFNRVVVSAFDKKKPCVFVLFTPSSCMPTMPAASRTAWHWKDVAV